MEGRIVRGIGGFYFVHTGDSVYACKARGIFRKENIKPLPGDRVLIRVLSEEEKEGSIEQILPRKNELIRPAVANIDQALAVFAITSPGLNFNLLDRLLVTLKRREIPAVLVFNKKDLASESQIAEIEAHYAGSGYPCFFVSAKTGEGIEALRCRMRGKTSSVAGPSGAGKSSLINLLQEEERLDTGEISQKIQRGRHTTRHTRLLYMEKDTYILDTPGFSSVEFYDLQKEELGDCFPEIRERKDACRFAGCSHLSEPDCAVKKALLEGAVSRGRYESYRLFYEELKERKKY